MRTNPLRHRFPTHTIYNCRNLRQIDMIMEQQANLYLFLLFLFLASSLFLISLAKIKKSKRKKSLPSPPWPLPVLGHLHLLDSSKPHRSLLTLSYKHGPLFLLRLGSIPTLIVSSRDKAEEIFTNHDLTFSNRPVLTRIKKLTYDCANMAFAPHGDQWRQARKITIFELLNPRRIQSFQAVRGEEVERLIAAIKNSKVANLNKLTLLLANNVICRVALGDEVGDEGYGGKGAAWLQNFLLETQRLLLGFCAEDLIPGIEWVDRLLGFHGRLQKHFDEMDKFLDGVISQHVGKGEKEEGCGDSIRDGGEEEKEDFVQVLLRLHKVAVLRGGFLSKMDHIKAVLFETFVAGTEAISATIEWTMTELIRNPRIMNKLQEELKQATNGNMSRLIQENELEKLEYLKQVIQESLRLRPLVPLIPRQTSKACELGGYIIPAKTLVIFNNTAISTDPNVWDNPLEFWPERFEGSKVDYKGQDFGMLPFGLGRRKCPAINFAMVIVEITLANLLHCFNWSLPDGMKVEDINMEEFVGLNARKKEALCLVAKSK